MKNTELIPLQIEDKIIQIRKQNVMLDRDVAEIYGVQTMRVNEAVKNNPDKFPEGYILEVQSAERQELIENFDRFASIKHSISTKAFTEKGLYMLATILKSPQATKATVEIVEAFAKMRELSRNIAMISSMEPEIIEPEIVEKTGNLLSDMLFSHLPKTSEETSLEFNFGVVKGKKTIKSDNGALQTKIDRMEKMMEEINKKLEIF
jgi:predicted XRE-type DNA-binding protein